MKIGREWQTKRAHERSEWVRVRVRDHEVIASEVNTMCDICELVSFHEVLAKYSEDRKNNECKTKERRVV